MVNWTPVVLIADPSVMPLFTWLKIWKIETLQVQSNNSPMSWSLFIQLSSTVTLALRRYLRETTSPNWFSSTTLVSICYSMQDSCGQILWCLSSETRSIQWTTTPTTLRSMWVTSCSDSYSNLRLTTTVGTPGSNARPQHRRQPHQRERVSYINS